MVDSWVGTQVVQAACGASFEICGAKYQRSDTGIDESSCTHDAGLQGDHQVTVIEAPATKLLGGVSQG